MFTLTDSYYKSKSLKARKVLRLRVPEYINLNRTINVVTQTNSVLWQTSDEITTILFQKDKSAWATNLSNVDALIDLITDTKISAQYKVQVCQLFVKHPPSFVGDGAIEISLDNYLAFLADALAAVKSCSEQRGHADHKAIVLKLAKNFEILGTSII